MRTSTPDHVATTLGAKVKRLLLDDHCEWANRYVYWLKTPLGVLGVGAVASLACGLWVAPQGYAVLLAILAVIAIGLAWPWLGIRGLGCELRFATNRSREGRPTGVDVTITNRWPWPVWGLAIENGFFVDSEDRAATALARINGWSRTTFRWEFEPERRGVYPTEAPSLVTEFPFGLWKAQREVSIDDQLVVWPATFWLPPFPLQRGNQDWTGHPNDAHTGHEGERVGLREHRAGDSLRMVHWAKTAAFDRLIVVEREGASHCSASLDLDTDPESYNGDADVREWSLRIAASVCETLMGQGVGVLLRLQGRERLFLPNQSDTARLMDLLAMFDSESPSEAGRSSVKAGAPGGIALWIGSPRSEPRAGLGIVLQKQKSSETDRPATPIAGKWIDVDCFGEVPEQVLGGWRAAARETSRAS